MMSLDEYLSQPCDDPDCDRTATHNAASRTTGEWGKFCNAHMDWDKPARARND